MRILFILIILMLPQASQSEESTTISVAPKRAEKSVVQEIVRRLQESIGACIGCKTNPTAREAGEAPLGKTSLKDLHGRKIIASEMNDEYALKIFQEMTVQQKIPFGFPEDGCYARAHEMAYQLDKKGISTGKVFAHGFFRIDSDKAINGYVSWIFHVAPFVVVNSGKNREIWVIDPSLFFEPVSLETWLKTLNAHPKSKISKVYLTSRYNYHWRDRDTVLKDFDEEDLGSARRTMKRFLKREDHREKTKTPDL
jgi:hypothetical protein